MATVIGRAVVLVNAQMEKGSAKKIGEDIEDSVPGEKIGEKIGEDIVKGSGDAGSKFGDKFKTGLNVASVGIIGAATGAVVGLNKIGDTFDGVVDTLRAGTGATGDDLEALTKVAKNVGTEVAASFDDIGPTVADLNTRLGLTGDELQTVSKQVLEAGRVFDTELDISKLSSGFSAFGVESGNIEEAMDRLFTASQASGVGMNELADMAAKTAPQMKALGFSFDETVGMIGTLDKAGIDAASVAGSMGKALVNLAKDGEEPQEAFRRTVGEIKNFVDTGDDIKANEMAIKLFGTKGSTNFLNALRSGKIGIGDLAEIAGETSDTILGVGADTEDFAESWQKFTNKMLVAVEPLASKVFGMIAEGFDTISPKIEAAVGWVEENIELVKKIAIGVGIFAAGIVVLNAGLTAYNAIVGTVSAVTKIWAGVQMLLNATLLANPITWVVIAVVALVAGIVLAYQKIGWFKDGLNELWENIKVGAAGVGEWIGNAVSNVIGFFSAIPEFIVWVGTSIGGVLEGIGQKVAEFAGKVVGAVPGIISSIGGFFGQIGKNIGLTFDIAVMLVQKKIENVMNFFRSIGDAIGSVFTGIGNTIKGIFTQMVGIIKGAVNAVIGSINAPINAINKIQIKVPNWVPGIGGASWGPSLPTIPSFADGGVVAPRPGGQLVRVAERNQAERIMSEYEYQRDQRELKSLRKADINNSGSSGSTFNVNGYNKDPYELYAEFNRLEKWNG